MNKISKKHQLRIGILLIATGKYTRFINQFVDSANKYFLKGKKYNITYFVFTNGTEVPENAVRLYKEHKSFPYPTLTRFHSFCEYEEQLTKMDYLFYSDVDMRFVSRVSEEVLGDLMGVIHPGYFASPREEFPYETNTKSKAYIKPGEGSYYFCGGFNGGRAKSFLKMSKTIKHNVDEDLKHGIVAKVHDESHLNRYFKDNPPEVILDSSYCYPEGQIIPFKPKLVALNKNHAIVRYSGTRMVTSYLYELYETALHRSWLIFHQQVLIAKKTIKNLVNRILDMGMVVALISPSLRERLMQIQAGIRYSQTTVSESFHINCIDLHLTDSNVLDLVTMAYNNDYVIELQIKFLKRYLKDKFFYTVIDHSTNSNVSKRILKVCKQEGVGYIFLPDYGKKMNPSTAHGLVINWTYKNFIKPRGADYFGIIDSDIFPIKITGIIKHLQRFPVYGWIQERSEKWYLWSGFAFFSRGKIPSLNLDFLPGFGLDTGGRNWTKIYSLLDKSGLAKVSHRYALIDDPYTKNIKKQEVTKLVQNDKLIEFMDNWMHTFNGSNWRSRHGSKNNKINKLIQIINKDDSR